MTKESKHYQRDDHIYINFPISKEKQDLQIGDTVIDFTEGTVEHPDGTIDYLSEKLEGTRFDAVGSLYVDTTAKIKVTFDDRDSQWILSRFQTQGTKIRRLRITASQSTSLAISASTNLYYSLYKAVGIDIQTRYQEKTTRTISSPVANTTYYLPVSSYIDIKTFTKSVFTIYADASLSATVETSIDGGVTFRELAGYKIDKDLFEVDKVNTIPVNISLEYIRLKIITDSNAPSRIELANIRKS